MTKKVALITVHGMGETPPDYDHQLIADLSRRLGSRFDQVHVGRVYYQSLLQDNEEKVWKRMASKVGWKDLRKFVLYGFADATGLETGKHLPDGVYTQTQIQVAQALLAARNAVGDSGPVVILAQSLGCQVVSCFFWDANRQPHPHVGIWQDLGLLAQQINQGVPLTDGALHFLRGGTLRALLTTGCNIPIFVAAHSTKDILPIHPNPVFQWHNFYDRDDVLGWPLADLSPEYGEVVSDHAVNADSGVWGWLIGSWNPQSHNQYWADKQVLNPLEQQIRQFL